MEPMGQPAAQGEHNEDQSLNTGRTYTYRHAWSHMDILDRLNEENYLSATIEELFGNIIIKDEPHEQQKELIEHAQKEAHQLPLQLNPGTCNDIEDRNYTAPPNLAPSPEEPMSHDSPFPSIYMDFFQVDQSYLAIMDRHSNWLWIFCLTSNDSTQIENVLREYFNKWGVAKEVITSWSNVLTSSTMADSFRKWGITYHASKEAYEALRPTKSLIL